RRRSPLGDPGAFTPGARATPLPTSSLPTGRGDHPRVSQPQVATPPQPVTPVIRTFVYRCRCPVFRRESFFGRIFWMYSFSPITTGSTTSPVTLAPATYGAPIFAAAPGAPITSTLSKVMASPGAASPPLTRSTRISWPSPTRRWPPDSSMIAYMARSCRAGSGAGCWARLRSRPASGRDGRGAGSRRPPAMAPVSPWRVAPGGGWTGPPQPADPDSVEWPQPFGRRPITASPTSMLGRGIYTMAEAGRYAGVSSRTAKAWFEGWPQSRSGPVLHSDYAQMTERPVVSFLDFTDLLVVAQLRKVGASMQSIRRAYDALEPIVGSKHPFSHSDLYADQTGTLFRRAATAA